MSRQIDVKAKYALWVTRAERDAMASVLPGCGGTMEIITTTAAPSRTTTTKPAPRTTTQAPLPKPTTAQAPQPPSDVSYKNCAAVRAAGKAPLMRGEPEYRPGLDRDHDGVACE